MWLRRALRVFAGASVVIGVVGLAALAWAYWTAPGNGSASVTVGTLSAPAGVTATATPGSATVPVTWSASSAPGGNTIDGYYVQRYAGSTASPACGSSPSALLSATATACNDTSVANGTYTYRATAVFRSWTAASDASAAVTVNVSTPHLAFVKQPGGGTGGVAWATQPKVAVVDGSGNTLTGVPSVAVTLSVTAGTGNASGVLSCTANPKSTLSGAAAFAGCKITSAGTGYTLTATAPGYPSAVSSPFNVAVGPATQLTFVQPPSSVVAGAPISPSVTVAVQDAGGNGVPSTVAIAFGTNAGPGTLSGTLSQSAPAGVATFADLSVDVAASGYTLKATSSGLTATSTTFTVNPGAPVAVAFARQPGGGTGGVAWSSQPKVAVVDALGNTVPAAPLANVTLSVTPGTGNSLATLSCTTNPTGTVAGIATFSNCKIGLAGTGYTLTASATGYPSVVSNPFNVTVGPATQLVFMQPPSTVVAGAVMSPALTVGVEDAGGNIVSSSSAPVSIAFGTNAGGGTLSGTLLRNASNGVATFSDLSIDVASSGYTLKVTSAGLTAATSATFTVNPGAPVALLFLKVPGTPTHNVVFGTQPKVAVVDAFGNTVSVSPVAVSLSITPGSGNPSAVLSCTANPKSTVAGVATFAGCKINLVGTGYTLTASAPGYPSAISTPFNVS